MDYRSKIDSNLAQLSLIDRQLEEETQTLAQLKTEVSNIVSAQQITQEAAEFIQSNAHKQISSVVTRCLQTIFPDDPYEFKIVFESKRGKTEAKLVFIRDGQELDPLEASGGGMVDIASFALRLAAMMLSHPRKRRLLVADEPFKNINGTDNQERVGKLLMTLAKELDIQMIFVSDDDFLTIGKVLNMEE